MFKKYVSILMLFSALAIMLGHNFIPHHHHVEKKDLSHHHNDGHHHDHTTDTDNDTEGESNDWGHFFSNFQHGVEGLTFISSHTLSNNIFKQVPQFTALHSTNFIYKQILIEVRQNAPPYIVGYINSQNLLPFGLRAPPIVVV